MYCKMALRTSRKLFRFLIESTTKKLQQQQQQNCLKQFITHIFIHITFKPKKNKNIPAISTIIMIKKNEKSNFIGSLNDFVHHFPLLGMVAAKKN